MNSLVGSHISLNTYSAYPLPDCTIQPLCGSYVALVWYDKRFEHSAYVPVYDGVGGVECRDRACGAVGIVPAAPKNTFVFTLSTALRPAHERALLSYLYKNEFWFGCTWFTFIV